jgi:large subunit ribosomal protein L18
MIKRFNANRARLRRHRHIRQRLTGVSSRPRLNVFRSGQHIYAQIIDDTTGRTLVAASSLDESLQNFKSAQLVDAEHARTCQEEAPAQVEAEAVVAEVAPVKEKGAKSDKSAKPQAKGGKPGTQVKTVLPAAQRGERKTPKEALAPIANNRKVALAREVGKLVAERAKEKGVTRVVFDRGGYAYHGRVAALAEGAREVGLDF